VELLCGNVDAVAGLAARTAKVCADSAIANFGPMSRFFAGAALAVGGDVESGLAEMRPALVEHREVVGSHITGIMLGFMASAYGQAGQWEEGLRRADEGIALGETTREQVYAAELWRVKGELLLGKAFRVKGGKRAEAGGMSDVAEKCLRRALEIARQQEARSLALKAAMSLARLCVGGAAHQEARELLRSLYASFTEGFDTKDLKDAKAILDLRSGAERDAKVHVQRLRE
jgi:predicted ATPase